MRLPVRTSSCSTEALAARSPIRLRLISAWNFSAKILNSAEFMSPFLIPSMTIASNVSRRMVRMSVQMAAPLLRSRCAPKAVLADLHVSSPACPAPDQPREQQFEPGLLRLLS